MKMNIGCQRVEVEPRLITGIIICFETLDEYGVEVQL
jgi:hypothetical protein